MSTQRQPKGIPVGGQFAANSHDEADANLVNDEPDHEPIPWEVEGGYVQEGHYLLWGDGVENDALEWTYNRNPEFKMRYLLAGEPTSHEGRRRLPRAG